MTASCTSIEPVLFCESNKLPISRVQCPRNLAERGIANIFGLQCAEVECQSVVDRADLEAENTNLERVITVQRGYRSNPGILSLFRSLPAKGYARTIRCSASRQSCLSDDKLHYAGFHSCALDTPPAGSQRDHYRIPDLGSTHPRIMSSSIIHATAI